MPDPLLILGASTRAAASSAIRAGLSPLTADLFCDDDLCQMTDKARRVSDYPSDLPSLARDYPPSAWMFTGGLENHPRIIDEISAERVLWGTPAGPIQRVRDPWQLSQRLHHCGLPCAEVLRADQRETIGRRSRSRWIRKPFHSAGGGNMQLLSACRDVSQDTDSTDAQRDDVLSHYLQRVVDGESQSAVFVAARGEAVLLGVTRQLIGASWTGATGFRYGGSIGPLQPSATHLSQWWAIGDGLASGFDLRGLFGVDAIVNDRGIWAIEVNPRYTSSIEVLEFGLEFHAVTDHVAACRDGQLEDCSPAAHGRFRGKAIIYAGRDVRIDDAFVRTARQANAEQTWPVVADIPTAAQTIAAGHPVATVFASSDRLTDVEPRLRDAVQARSTKWKL